MKILFLDIDGVLNCERTRKRKPDKYIGIDPYMVVLVDRIIQATGCKVVLSSTWRCFALSRKEVRKAVEIFDITDQRSSGIRGDEVQDWLKHYPEVQVYAILDDNSDFHDDQPLFKTTWETGLTEEIANEVINHLNN